MSKPWDSIRDVQPAPIGEGVWNCPSGLRVEVVFVGDGSADIIVGMSTNPGFAVTRNSAAHLSEFFAELALQLS